MELSDSQKNDLAFNAFKFLTENPREIALGVTATFTVYHILKASIYHANVKQFNRLISNGQKLSPLEYYKIESINSAYKRAHNITLAGIGGILLGLQLLLLPTEARAETMGSYYLNEGFEELKNMSDQEVKQRISFYPDLRDGLILTAIDHIPSDYLDSN